jgi:hypothetical protein
MDQATKNLIAKAAKKAGVPAARLTGPMPANTKPLRDRAGLYLRVSQKTGDIVWAWWNGTNFGLYADTKARATARRGKRSKKPLVWFGMAAAK